MAKCGEDGDLAAFHLRSTIAVLSNAAADAVAAAVAAVAAVAAAAAAGIVGGCGRFTTRHWKSEVGVREYKNS